MNFIAHKLKVIQITNNHFLSCSIQLIYFINLLRFVDVYSIAAYSNMLRTFEHQNREK